MKKKEIVISVILILCIVIGIVQDIHFKEEKEKEKKEFEEQMEKNDRDRDFLLGEKFEEDILEITPIEKLNVSSDGRWNAFYKIKNNGTKAVDYVNVNFHMLDEDDRFVACAEGFVYAPLDKGKTAVIDCYDSDVGIDKINKVKKIEIESYSYYEGEKKNIVHYAFGTGQEDIKLKGEFKKGNILEIEVKDISNEEKIDLYITNNDKKGEIKLVAVEGYFVDEQGNLIEGFVFERTSEGNENIKAGESITVQAIVKSDYLKEKRKGSVIGAYKYAKMGGSENRADGYTILPQSKRINVVKNEFKVTE